MPGAHFSHSFPIVNVGQIHRPVSGSQICPGCSQGKHSARENKCLLKYVGLLYLKEFLVYLCSRLARIPRIRVSIGRKWFQWCRVYNDIVRLHRRSRHHMRPLDHRHTLYYSPHPNWCSNSHTDIRDISCLALFVHIDIVQFENRIDLEQILSDGIGKLKE